VRSAVYITCIKMAFICLSVVFTMVFWGNTLKIQSIWEKVLEKVGHVLNMVKFS